MEHVVTLADVIHKRQGQLLNEKVDLEQEAMALEERLRQVKGRLDEVYLEYQFLEQSNDRRMVAFQSDTLTGFSRAGRKSTTDRLSFEDSVRKIFELAGRPLAIGELISELEDFGFIWSGYTPAYNYISRSDVIEFAGKRGFYQLRRSR